MAVILSRPVRTGPIKGDTGLGGLGLHFSGTRLDRALSNATNQSGRKLSNLGEQIVILFRTAVACQVLSQPLAKAFCFALVRLVAEGMSQFVADCESQELVKRNTPSCEQLELSLRLKHDQGFV